MEQFGQIIIEDLKVDCIIGVDEAERVKKQPVIINLELEADLSRAAQSDSVTQTVDYAKVHHAVIRYVSDSNFYLLERLAYEIAGQCLKFNGVRRVYVTVKKEGALTQAKSVGVTVVLGK